MGREMKRVPLDFNWPLNKVWYGYQHISACSDDCESCKLFAKIKGYEIGEKDYDCPKYPELEAMKEPPTGDGYQLWDTTSEGSPQSPVFETLDALCEWCADNATTFADFKATKEKWKKMFDADFVCHEMGNVVFM